VVGMMISFGLWWIYTICC